PPVPSCRAAGRWCRPVPFRRRCTRRGRGPGPPPARLIWSFVSYRFLVPFRWVGHHRFPTCGRTRPPPHQRREEHGGEEHDAFADELVRLARPLEEQEVLEARQPEDGSEGP